MSLPREKATQAADLPHQFEGVQVLGGCHLCSMPLLDARHLAWEKAQQQPATHGYLHREMGV